MSKGNNSPGISRLAGVMQSMVVKGKDAPVFDLAIIQANGSLLADNFPIPISAGEYQVCRHLSARKAQTSSADGHTHSVETREKIKAGDRVLLAWVEDEPIVIDIIMCAADAL